MEPADRRPRPSVSPGAAVRLAMLLFAAALTQSVLAEPLRVGVCIGQPPFGFIDEERRIVGLDIDVARALCAAIDAQCELAPTDWEAIVPSLETHRLDLAVASMSITDNRLRKIDFTRPYYDSPNWFLARRGRFSEATPGTVKGRRIGVHRGTIHDDYATDLFADRASILRYGSTADALLDLLLDRIDLVLADSIMLERNFLATPWGKGFEQVGAPLWDPARFGRGAGVALPKGRDALRERLNRAIGEIRENGVFARIARTWLGPNALELTRLQPESGGQ